MVMHVMMVYVDHLPSDWTLPKFTCGCVFDPSGERPAWCSGWALRYISFLRMHRPTASLTRVAAASAATPTMTIEVG